MCSAATSGSASQTIRSSSACPTTSARRPSESTSRSVLISPTASKLPASTTVSASLSRSVCPFLIALTSIFGEQVSRILRPEVNTSTVSSSCAPSITPYPLGGWPSRSTSSRSASSC